MIQIIKIYHLIGEPGLPEKDSVLETDQSRILDSRCNSASY